MRMFTKVDTVVKHIRVNGVLFTPTSSVQNCPTHRQTGTPMQRQARAHTPGLHAEDQAKAGDTRCNFFCATTLHPTKLHGSLQLVCNMLHATSSSKFSLHSASIRIFSLYKLICLAISYVIQSSERSWMTTVQLSVLVE